MTAKKQIIYMKMESLNKDFQQVAAIVGNVTSELPHLNATKKEFYTSYYDKETIEIVRECFKEDIALFGYTFGEREEPINFPLFSLKRLKQKFL